MERKPVHYEEYQVSPMERIAVCALGIIAVEMAACIFFQPGWMLLMPLPLCIVFPKLYAHFRIARRKRILTSQFQELLGVLASSLSAGQSVENAFLRAWADLSMLYANEEAPMLAELRRIRARLELGDNIEQALVDLSERSGVEEIRDFTAVFKLAKRSGGNLVEVMRHTAQMIQEKLYIQKDIEVLIARKKLEAKFMCLSPFVMIALLRISSPEYMAPLYQGSGILIMVIALLLLLGTMKIVVSLSAIKV